MRMVNLSAYMLVAVVLAGCFRFAFAKITEADVPFIVRLISNAEASKVKCGLNKYPLNDLCRPCDEVCGPQLDKTLCFFKCPVVYEKLFLINPALNLLNPKIQKVAQHQSSQNASIQLLREFVNEQSGQQKTVDFTNTYVLYSLVGGLYFLALTYLLYSCRARLNRLFKGVSSSCHTEHSSSQSSATLSQTTAVTSPPAPPNNTAAAPVAAAAQNQQQQQMNFNQFPAAIESSETEEKVHPMSTEETHFTNRGHETDPLVVDVKNGR